MMPGKTHVAALVGKNVGCGENAFSVEVGVEKNRRRANDRREKRWLPKNRLSMVNMGK